MADDGIPMPRPPDRLRALLTDALVRSDKAERMEDRLAGLLNDAQAGPVTVQTPKTKAPRFHLFAIILTRCADRDEVCMQLKTELGCERALPVCDNVWLAVAKDGVFERIRTGLNDMFKHQVAVLVLEIHGSHALATPASMDDLVELIRQYN